MNKINEATFFYSSLKKNTDEGHLKQMREGLRNIFFVFGLIEDSFSYFSNKNMLHKDFPRPGLELNNGPFPIKI